MVKFENDWDDVLSGEFDKQYYKDLREFLKQEYFRSGHNIFPPMDEIFNAQKLTSYGAVKAVILGQDPYHEQGQAQGLCFSVRKGVQKPPSLVNIFKELQADTGIEPPTHGSLVDWAKNGVLLLNTVLTVREHQANSHRGHGWEKYTDRVIELLNQRDDPMVFILWGNNAKAKQSLITNSKHLVLTGAHPSPLSAYNGFFGGRYFSRTNDFLAEGIDWRISE
ncbi:MAG: uracil-DNA glycosylase [Eubacteriaceae bacterium]|jgi:uracil-DNA glycosylase|nr:uracil-DNA glycosylase [Eubacteriaceae bacterium]